jgi:hypothetical protein
VAAREEFALDHSRPPANPGGLAARFPWSNAEREAPHGRLLAELEPLGHRLVPSMVGRQEVIQQATSLANHHEQATTGTVILFVLLQMFGQLVDALRQQSDLHIRRPGVFFVDAKVSYRLALRFHTVRVNFQMEQRKYKHPWGV